MEKVSNSLLHNIVVTSAAEITFEIENKFCLKGTAIYHRV